MMKITSLAIYPIKGVRAVPLTIADIEARGLWSDRRWMVVDADNRFVTQRDEPRLATIKGAPRAGGLTVELPGEAPLHVTQPAGSSRLSVQVWKSTVDAALADDGVSDRLSAFLGRPMKLVFMDDKAARFSNPDWAGDGAPLSFADGYPILLTTTASLAALNGTIRDQDGAPVSMERFRPNVVLDGPSAWDEDAWAAIRIGDLVFDLVKPCSRCIVPTLDQMTGDARPDNQPTKALVSTRRSADPRVKGVLFGWNMVARTEGSIRVGDQVTVLEQRERWPIRPTP